MPPTWAAIASKIGLTGWSFGSRSPPGMMLGPVRAPSSPPDTPTPRRSTPCSATDSCRRCVSQKFALPPSMARHQRQGSAGSQRSQRRSPPPPAPCSSARAAGATSPILDGLMTGQRTLLAVFLHERLHAAGRAVVHRDRDLVMGDVARQVRAHRREAGEAEVRFRCHEGNLAPNGDSTAVDWTTRRSARGRQRLIWWPSGDRHSGGY